VPWEEAIIQKLLFLAERPDVLVGLLTDPEILLGAETKPIFGYQCHDVLQKLELEYKRRDEQKF
jgi:hypothetical protein